MRCHAARERGAALLTAMIIVALIATLAASMLWQQWRAVQVEAAERERAQSAWILAGALDWARLILREDAKAGVDTDHLGEPWSVPLQEARLSSFLASDKGPIEDAPDAFLSGEIADANARFNLANLVAGGEVNPVELKSFQRLCQNIGVADDVAIRIASGLRDASPVVPPAPGSSAPATTRPANPPLMPRSVSELVWLGVDPESLRTLLPYVGLLPVQTVLNVNTASREVIAATVDGMDLATAERIVQARQRAPLKAVVDLKAFTGALPETSLSRLGFKTDWFEVRGRLRLGQVVLEQRSLVQRRGRDIYVIQRERLPGRDTGHKS